MAGLLETILKAGNGGAVKTLASNFGLGERDTAGAISKLLPALTGGLQKNMESTDGLQSLMGALSDGHHGGYIDQPERVTRPDSVEDGNSILGHLLGSKETSRQVAAEASQSTGIDAGVLKKMLPMVAALAMGAMNKQSAASGLSSAPESAPQAKGLLSSLLDKDNDGSVVDDVMGMLGKMF